MQITIHAPFDVKTDLKDLIDKKVSKLLTFYDRIIKVEVYLKLEVANSPKGKIAEISVSLPGKDAFAKETSDTFEKAIAATADKLERQLKKRKDKLKST